MTQPSTPDFDLSDLMPRSARPVPEVRSGLHPDVPALTRHVGWALFVIGMVGLLGPAAGWLLGHLLHFALPSQVWWAMAAWPVTWALCTVLVLLGCWIHPATRPRARSYAWWTARDFPLWTLMCLFGVVYVFGQ